MVRLVSTQDNPYSFFRIAAYWAYNKPLLTYIHAWFVGYGLILIVLLYKWRYVLRFLAEHQYLFIYIIGFSVMAWIGGSDTERILYWSMPAIYLLVGKTIEDNPEILGSRLFLGVLFGTQILSQRVFWSLPDYPNSYTTPFPILTILSNQFQYLDLYSYHGNGGIQAISLAEYLAAAFVLLLILNTRKIKRSFQMDPPTHEEPDQEFSHS